MEYKINKKAMLVGYLLGDGWITVGVNSAGSNYKNIGFSGDVCDLELIIEDVRECFGDYVGKATIRQVQSESPKYNIKGISNSVCLTTNIANEFLKLDCPYGKRVEKETEIPGWILNGNKSTIASFISGMYSAEGGMPRLQTNGKTPKTLEFIFTKRLHLKENGDRMSRDFISMLNKIRINAVVRTENTFTVDHNVKYIISICNECDNILRAYRVLDFRYCARKEDERVSILEYLEYKQSLVDYIIKAKEYILSHPNESNKSLADKLNLNVTKIIKIKTGVCKLSTPKKIMKYDDFKIQCCSL